MVHHLLHLAGHGRHAWVKEQALQEELSRFLAIRLYQETLHGLLLAD
jgi:hypothetical protein